ncbi:MAG TPA: DUF6152 family protein [Gammaproteobacteria bacterium]
MKLINRIALTIGATTLAGSALAHHSGHFFVDETVTLTGTVKEMQLTNPHSWIEMMVPNDQGELVQWSIEMSAPIVLFRRGWTRETVKPGDEVTVVARPMRDGRPGAIYVNITLPDGSTLGRVDLTD